MGQKRDRHEQEGGGGRASKKDHRLPAAVDEPAQERGAGADGAGVRAGDDAGGGEGAG